MSFNRDRYDARRRPIGPSHRTPLGYWVPLLLTVTAATVGIAAWIWSERRDSDNDDDDDYQRTRRSRRAPSSPPSFRDDLRPGETSYGEERVETHNQEREEATEYGRKEEYAEEQESMITRTSGAIRRTPSPQQRFDSASKRVVAGVAAAGAVVGRGLGAIREETPKDDFADHERWSEEAEQREHQVGGGMDAETEAAAAMEAIVPSRMLKGGRGQGQGQARGKKKMIAVVVSADSGSAGHVPDEDDATYQVEHAVSPVPIHCITYQILSFCATVNPLPPPLRHRPCNHTTPHPHLRASPPFPPTLHHDRTPSRIVHCLLLCQYFAPNRQPSKRPLLRYPVPRPPPHRFAHTYPTLYDANGAYPSLATSLPFACVYPRVAVRDER